MRVSRWDGADWIDQVVKRYTDADNEHESEWITVLPKFWDGAHWVTGDFDDAVVVAYSGNPTDDGFEISVQTASVSFVRVAVSDLADTPVLTTGPVAVPEYDITKMPVTGLAPGTKYNWQVEVSSSVDGPFVASGVPGQGRTKFSFDPESPADYSYKIALTGCQKLFKTETATWDDFLTFDPDFHIQGGDWTYTNELGMTVAAHRMHWNEQLLNTAGMPDRFREYTLFGYARSDHDGGGGQAATIQHPSTPYNIEAYKQVIPHPSIPDFAEATSTCFATGLGDILYIFTDIRTLARSPADDPETDDKWAIGEEQTEWVLEQFARTDYAIKCLVTDCPWPGDAADVHPKDDHWARYPNNRAMIIDAMEDTQGFIIQFDYHGLVGNDEDHGTPDGWPLIGCAGSTNDTGNIREDDWPNYQYIYGEKQVPVIDIAVWGQLTVERVDDEVTITMVGRNALDLVDEFTIEKTFTV